MKWLLPSHANLRANHEVVTPIPCKLVQRVPKNQINIRESKNTQQAQLEPKERLRVHERRNSKNNGTTMKQ